MLNDGNENNNINYGSINNNHNIIPHHDINPIQSSTIQIHAHLSSQKRRGLRSAQIPAKLPPKSPYFRPFSPALTTRSATPKFGSVLSHRMVSPEKSKEISTSAESDSDSDEDRDKDDDNLISVWQAGFTIINLFLGLCLLSYPYALFCGSFISLIAFIFISFALCYTGKLIVRCFDKLPFNVSHTYPLVGLYSFGLNNKFGYYLISCGIVAELFGALCTNTIFLWKNLSYLLLPFGLNINQIILICILVSLPTCWMLNFNDLSINSFLGCICKVFTAIVIIITFSFNTDIVSDNIATHSINIFPQNMQSFCISIGIYIMSFAGHPCLPSIYRQMKNPAQFEKMLDICFIIMCCVYLMISIFGYLTFGTNTNIVITANLLSQNIYLSRTLIILVVAGCYFQISPLVAVMAEIPENNIFKLTTFNNKNKFKIRILRTILFIFICIMSYICFDKLALIEACTGSICTMIVSVICPALFYYKLFLYKNKQKNNILLTIILYLYVICGTALGIYMFTTDITNALK